MSENLEAVQEDTTKKVVPALERLKGTKTVKRANYQSGEATEEVILNEDIQVPDFEVAPAYVRVSANAKKNMGNYESVGIDVSVSLPCYPTRSEIVRVADWASRLVDQMMRDETEYALGRHADGQKG